MRNAVAGQMELARPPLSERVKAIYDRFLDVSGELFKNKLAAWGAVTVLVLVLIAVLAPYIERYDPIAMNQDALLQKPGLKHFFGTDQYGRDVWSRVVHGARRALWISVAAVLLGISAGVPLGAVSGYFGKMVDNILMRVVDAWLAMPGILFFLVMATIFRAHGFAESDWSMIIVLGIAQIPLLARLVRGTFLQEKEKEYVEACRATGESNPYIIFRQILPNCLSPVIVQATIAIGYLMIIDAALGFLGLGAQPPTPSWGNDLSAARGFMETAPHLSVFPGIVLSLAVLGFNLFGDGLRDALDPRQVER